MPAARTGDQKRKMKGKPVNLKNYRSSDFNLGTEIKEASESPMGKAGRRVGSTIIGIILLITGCIGLAGMIFIPSMVSIIDKSCNFGIGLCEEEMMIYQILTNSNFWNLNLIASGIISIWFLYNGVMLSFHLKSPKWKPGLVLFIAWLMSILVLAGWTIRFVAEFIPQLIS